jgi:hypothetical protein
MRKGGPKAALSRVPVPPLAAIGVSVELYLLEDGIAALGV